MAPNIPSRFITFEWTVSDPGRVAGLDGSTVLVRILACFTLHLSSPHAMYGKLNKI